MRWPTYARSVSMISRMTRSHTRIVPAVGFGVEEGGVAEAAVVAVAAVAAVAAAVVEVVAAAAAVEAEEAVVAAAAAVEAAAAVLLPSGASFVAATAVGDEVSRGCKGSVVSTGSDAAVDVAAVDVL